MSTVSKYLIKLCNALKIFSEAPQTSNYLHPSRKRKFRSPFQHFDYSQSRFSHFNGAADFRVRPFMSLLTVADEQEV